MSKRVIVTGLNGTLAPVLAAKLQKLGFEVVPWDRKNVPPENPQACEAFISEVNPTYVCHLAMGDADWAASLAQITSKLNIPLLFSSTAMVFDQHPNGPHQVADLRTAKDDYGKGKIACEDVIKHYNSQALIVRIGWQIDWQSDGNNMFASLKQMQQKQGKIQASKAWVPATSMMTDTCDAFIQLLQQGKTGTYQVDSNRNDALTFAQLVTLIKQKFNLDWVVQVTEDYEHDQRLPDPRLKIPNISSHL